MKKSFIVFILATLLASSVLLQGASLTLVRDGVPQAAIWFAEGEPPADRRTPVDRQAAEDLVATIRQMTGATLELKTLEKDGRPEDDMTAVIVGTLARQMGLPPPPQTVSKDGYRILVKGRHLLLAGENADSTFFAASHLLETFGCRWFFDNDIGTVIPEQKTLEVPELDITEQPDFISRSLWGPNWRGTGWVRHNRLGGMALNSGHNWPRFFCTTDPQVRADYLANVIERVRGKGPISISISPPDGTAYCKCDRCKALDIADYLEPSSGTPVMSDRYQEFYNYIASEVKKVNPEAILCHYAYADYTLPPQRVAGGLENLCVSIAPIRFCRVHSLANPICDSRQRCREMVLGWGQVEKKMVWREYNYNLAEITVPMSKISIWKDDIPWLKQQGCIGLNIECLYMPHLYGPHTYLVARMAWDADLDVAAVMDDLYTRFCGPAAPHVKAYWERIDKAYVTTPVHAGGFHGVHAFWTPEMVAAGQADLKAAAQAVAGNALLTRRVAMFQMGLDNARLYTSWREAVNRCDFVGAQKQYDALFASMEAAYVAKTHPIGEYKHGYVKRFLGKGQAAGLERVTGERQLVVQLPDAWMFRYDPEDAGEQAGWFKGTVADGTEGWQQVKTYSATLNEQQIPEQLTWMWYQTTFRTPKTLPDGPMTLWFMEPDANTIKVWLNGKAIIETIDIRARQPLDIDLTGKLLADTDYVVTLKLHHRRISELMLGGLLRPVMIFSGTLPQPVAPVKKP